MRKKELTAPELEEYTRVAYYYYKMEFTQEEISQRMHISRQRVNRILRACIDLGIVKITISNLGHHMELELELERKYGLREVHVVSALDEDGIYEELGAAAAECLARLIKKGDIIGFSRGRSTSALVDHMPSMSLQDITVTQLSGNERQHIRSVSEVVEADDIVYRFAHKLQAKPSVLYAPIFVQSAKLRNSLMADPFFQCGYEMVRRCTIAVVGIGTAGGALDYVNGVFSESRPADNCPWYQTIAGEICAHFFDHDGNEVPPPFSDRIITVSHADYMNIPLRIGVAGLPQKADAIRAAAKGGYVNVLITDEKTARILLD